MLFNTKYGDVRVSNDVGKKFEEMAEIPLNRILVESIIDELPNKDKSTPEELEAGIYKEALREQRELQEMREMEKRGVTIVESDGLSLGVDENGNTYRFKRET